MEQTAAPPAPAIQVDDLTMAYGSFVLHTEEDDRYLRLYVNC